MPIILVKSPAYPLRCANSVILPPPLTRSTALFFMDQPVRLKDCIMMALGWWKASVTSCFIWGESEPDTIWLPSLTFDLTPSHPLLASLWFGHSGLLTWNLPVTIALVLHLQDTTSALPPCSKPFYDLCRIVSSLRARLLYIPIT